MFPSTGIFESVIQVSFKLAQCGDVPHLSLSYDKKVLIFLMDHSVSLSDFQLVRWSITLSISYHDTTGVVLGILTLQRYINSLTMNRGELRRAYL